MFWVVTLLLTLRCKGVELEATEVPCIGDDCWTSSVELSTPRVMCYQCRHCNNVTTSNLKVECEFAACCYIAVVTDSGNEEAFAVRGCAPVNKSCTDGCKQIQLEHHLAHPNGTFGYCITCKRNECNVNHYNPSNLVYTGVNCYECRDCNKINGTTPTVRCPQPECCYMAVLKDHLDGQSFTVRGCMKQNCSDTCGLVRSQHLQTHAGGVFHLCMTCGAGEGDECNGYGYNPKLFDGSVDEIDCFVCDDCKDIQMGTDKVRCGSKCCYSKIVMGRFQRGCVMDLVGWSCEEYCGRFDDYCDSCSDNKCNIQRITNDTAVHTVFRRTSYVNCFECVGCYSVVGAKTVNCPDRCCLMISWTENDETSMIRMCVKLNGKRCGDYCEHTREGIAGHDPNGVVHYCEDCTINKCNYVAVTAPADVVTYGPFAEIQQRVNNDMYVCYQCNYCEEVTSSTDVCMSNCCYSAVLDSDGETRTVRGCAVMQASANSCNAYCDVVGAEFEADHPDGEVVNCASCSSDNCNVDRWSMVMSGSHVREKVHQFRNFIYCYTCNNCNEISADVNRLKCLSHCCYAAQLFLSSNKTNAVRACALVVPGRPCVSYCKYVNEDHMNLHQLGSMGYCKVCETDNCNSESLQTRKLPIGRKEAFKCYKCSSCDRISKNTDTCSCRTKCCVTLVKTVHGVTSTTRSCARLNGVSCRYHCLTVGSRTSKVHFCEACNNTKCNRLPTKKFGINCYTCRNCKTITLDTPVLECESKCCYATRLQHDNGTVVAKRDCASVKSGQSCQDFCMLVRQEHTALHPIGAKHFYCRACSSDNCNDQNMNDTPPLKPSFSPKTCYNCINCYIFHKNTETIECPDGCCYTAIWTEYNRTLLVRLCAILEGIKCAQFCSHLTNRVKENTDHGTMRYCRTCCTTKCNSEPPPEWHELILPDPNDIQCYDCKDCNQVDTLTPTVPCPSKCCYAQLMFQNNGSRVIRRQCAKVFPGTSCQRYCSHAKNLHRHLHPRGSWIYCRVCSTNNCNDLAFDTAITGVKPAKTNAPVNKCFECQNCYSIQNANTTDCATGCCFTVVWTHFEETSLLRDCIRPDETPCAGYCENLKRLVRYSDRRGQIHLCEMCRTNECNHLKVEVTETSRPAIKCLTCKDCATQQDINDQPCYSYCCYAYSYTESVTSETKSLKMQRGCAHLHPGTRCNNYCDELKINVTIEDCKVCGQDGCNNYNVDQIKSP